jgi:hypothetical protein
VLAQRRRDGSPFESSGQVAGRKPRRSRALLACQQDTDEACRSWQGAACWFPEMRLKAPSPQGRPSSDLYNSARHGVRKAAHRQALNRLRGPQRSEADGDGGASSAIDWVNWQDAEPRTWAEHQRPTWHLRCWHAANRHDQAPRPPCRAAGATHGAAVRRLGYRQRMRSQLNPSRQGFQATGAQPPRRSKARAPAPGRGPAVPTATRPDPTPDRISGTPRPCGGLRPGRPAVRTLPRRRVGRKRRGVR